MFISVSNYLSDEYDISCRKVVELQLLKQTETHILRFLVKRLLDKN